MAHPWELTHQLSQYFDPHLIIPLLEFLTANGMYSETDLSKAKLELLKGTSMVDFYIEEHKKTYPDQAVPEEATVKRQSVVEEFRRLQEETKPLLDIFAEPSVTQQVKRFKKICFPFPIGTKCGPIDFSCPILQLRLSL